MRGLTILLVVAAASTAQSDSIGRLIVDAHAADAAIQPLAGDGRLILLPSLEYALTIEPQCATNMRPESISISVADTRKIVSAAEFDKVSLVEVSIAIPRRQIGPLAIDKFCRSDQSDAAAARELYVEDAFTAHLSLRCANDAARTIIYASVPLDVNLRCDMADIDASALPDDDDTSPNQESSSASTLR